MRFRRGPGELAIDVLIITVAVMIAVLALMGGDGTPPPAWAQQTSCGNAILEPPEQCDPPGSITCPPGSPAGAFLPCNPDCTCPGVNPICGNGILEGAEQCDPPGSITCPGSPAGAFLPCNQDCTCGPCVPTPENASPVCSDMIDNDCDGLIDCADPDCNNILPCNPAKKDPTIIKFGNGPLDLLRGHAKLERAPVDVLSMAVGILLTNLQGSIYSDTLPAGALTANASGTSFWYRNTNARTAGGISNLKIKQSRDGTSYAFKFASYADLSAATTPDMRLQFYLGEDANAAQDGRIFITLEAPWKQTPHGWRAPKDH